ncbi:hypothetical protein IQ269_27790 [Tychonema sp. LEGE 07199]|uniref:hypothetical protein n=1 Tax=unclassified Tychonema TaxID=2642144 RepID=UPI0018829E1E|nr:MULTISPECIES: hypothetical protein [unclassified Tychonema]MBE9124471.1 hypothetical protein [Tychonema sp. LEGE 07199]MBE9133574.1 hypothetical protein [Tychonema sp. LEGE 07196]
MSAAITINPYEIRQISQPDTVSQSRLRSIAQNTEALATRANAYKFYVNRMWYIGAELLSIHKRFN